MKTKRKDLKSALSQLRGVVCDKAYQPVLSCVRIAASDGTLTIEGTDIDTYARVSVLCDGDIGAVCVPLKPLVSAVNGKAETVEIVAETGRVVITCGEAATSINTTDAGDFPAPRRMEGAPVATIAAVDLARCLARTSYAMLRDESRPNLNGALFEISANGVRVVCADGHRLATDTIGEPPRNPAESARHIVPRVAVLALEKALKGAKTGSVEIRTLRREQAKFLEFRCDSWIVSARLIDGKYPDYNQVIPAATRYDRTLRIDRKALLTASKRAAAFARGLTAYATKWDINGALSLSINDPDKGKFSESVLCDFDHSNGVMSVIGFNSSYIADLLDSLDSDSVEIALLDNLSPLVIRGGDGFSAVVMPMRVD